MAPMRDGHRHIVVKWASKPTARPPSTLCQGIVDRLRAVALDQDEDLTPEERQALVEVALEVERRVRALAGQRLW